MIRIYLDWKIITNLLNPDRITISDMQKDFILLKRIFEYPGNDLIFPYSDAHLQDLMKSYEKGERDRVEESLIYLSSLTRNTCLTQYWNEETAKWHTRDPQEFFNSIIEDDRESFKSWDDLIEPLKEYGMEKIFDTFKQLPHEMDFKEIEKYNPFFASLFQRARIENTMYAAIQDIFDLFSKINSNPVVYKELRKMFRNGLMIDPNISNFDNAIEQLDKYLPKTMLNKSFTELYDLNNKSQSKNKNFDKIIGVYMQLDFVGYNPDKITSKNQYNNIFNDASHCFYASHCDYYLTNDTRNYKKSKAVYESENIATQVFNTTDFVNSINLTND
jgi:hypothetical protein